VYISMPTYGRHDQVNGDRFTGKVMARFAHVVVSPDSLAVASERLARGESRQTVGLAREEGDAIDGPLSGMLRSADVSGSQVRSGDYKVAVVVQAALRVLRWLRPFRNRSRQKWLRVSLR
jgi:hypothetical protein